MERHGITRDDLEDAAGDEDSLGSFFEGIFGKADPKIAARMRRESRAYIRASKDIASHLAVIQGQINFAVDAVDKLSPRYRAKTLCEFYKELKELLGDTSSWRQKNPLKPRRDQAVKDFYAHLVTERQEGEFASGDLVYVHISARDEVARATDLRKDTVENIVGKWERSMFEATLVCQVCGGTGPARLGAPPKWTRITGPGGGHRIDIHPDCL